MSVEPRTAEPAGIDDDFELLGEQIAALRELGAKDEVGEGESYDLSIRWGTALAGRLRRLVHYSAQGRLDADAQRRLQSLCAELRGLTDLIDRFGLAHPVFTDRPPAKAKRHRGARRAS